MKTILASPPEQVETVLLEIRSPHILAQVEMKGWRFDAAREIMYWTLAVMSGCLSLFAFLWWPERAIQLRYKPSGLSNADYVSIDDIIVPVEELSPTPLSERRKFWQFIPSIRAVELAKRMIIIRSVRFLFDPVSGTFERAATPARGSNMGLHYTGLSSAEVGNMCCTLRFSSSLSFRC